MADFERFEQLLAELPVELHATRPLWRTVAGILSGDPDAGPVPTVGVHPMLVKELRLRGSPAGVSGLLWLDERFEKGAAERPTRAIWDYDWDAVRDQGGAELESAVAAALECPKAGVTTLVSDLNRWLAHPDLPPECYQCLLYWAEFCTHGKSRLESMLSIRAHAAMLGAGIRCADEPSWSHAGRTLVELVDDWRDLDPLVGAYLALGWRKDERPQWADRAEAAALLRGTRQHASRRRLLREARARFR